MSDERKSTSTDVSPTAISRDGLRQFVEQFMIDPPPDDLRAAGEAMTARDCEEALACIAAILNQHQLNGWTHAQMLRWKLAALLAGPSRDEQTTERDDLGLSIDMLDVDRLREWARLILVHGPDISYWGSPTFVASKMQTLATCIEKAVRDIGTLRDWTHYQSAALSLGRPQDERAASPGETTAAEKEGDQSRMDTMGGSTDSRTASAVAPTATAGAGKRCCNEPAPDRSGRTCDYQEGHEGPHWTYGGNTLTWANELGQRIDRVFDLVCAYVRGDINRTTARASVSAVLSVGPQQAALSLPPQDDRAAEDNDGWLPINTAPEGEHVFVWMPNYGEAIACGTTHNGHRDWWAANRGEIIHPTHWRPRFKAPQEDRAAEKKEVCELTKNGKWCLTHHCYPRTCATPDAPQEAPQT